jgi:hypothetical protein
MTQDTEQLLFQSDIVANIDTAEAVRQLGDLAKNVVAVADATKAAFKGVDDYIVKINGTFNDLNARLTLAADRIGAIESAIGKSTPYIEMARNLQEVSRNLQDVTQRSAEWESQARQAWDSIAQQNRTIKETVNLLVRDQLSALRGTNEIPEQISTTTKKASENLKSLGNEAGLIASSIRGLMNRFSSNILGESSDTPGEFESFKRIKSAAADVIDQLGEMGVDVKANKDLIVETIESLGEQIEASVRKRGLSGELIIKAWKKVFDELIGHSIIPDLIDGMEKQLIDRASKILGDHQKYVEAALVPWQNASAKDAIGAYSQVIDEVEKENKRLKSGIIDQAREVDKLTDAMIQPMINNWEEYVWRWRSLQKMPVFTTLEQAQAEIEKRGLTTAEVIRAVDKDMKTLSGSIKDSFDAIGATITNTASNITTSIGAIPEKIHDAIAKKATEAFNKLPYAVAIATTNVVRELDKLGPAMKTTGQKLRDWLHQPLKQPASDTIAGILRAFEPLASQVGDIGKASAEATWTAFVHATNVSATAVLGAAKKVGEGIADQIRYAAGGAFDAVLGRDAAEKMRNALARAISYGMEGTVVKMREQMTQFGVDLETTQQKTDYVMRAMGQSFRESLRNVGVAFQNIRSGQLTFSEGFDGIRTAVRQSTRSLGLFTEGADSLDAAFARTMGRMQKSLSGYRRDGEFLDKSSQRLATSVDTTSDVLKTQLENFIKLQQGEKRLQEERLKALADYNKKYEAIVARELDATTAITAEEFEEMGAALKQSALKLEELGIGDSVFAGLTGGIKAAIAATDEWRSQTGQTIPISLTAAFESTADASTKLGMEITDQIKATTGVHAKQLSMMNRAIMDVEQNSKHFVTTLRDGGKVSTERLQDMRLAFEDLYRQMGEISKLQVADSPQARKYWENMSRNIVQEAENFQLLSQRALVVQRTKEQLFHTTRRVATAIGDAGKAAAAYLPIIGKNAKLSADQMDVLRGSSQRVHSSSMLVGNVLQQLDPVFMQVGQNAGYMGSAFREATENMAAVAAVKSSSIVKSLTMVKIAAAAVVGVFLGIIVSTGKLAAEITTLTMTMKVVAQNTGYNVKEVEKLVGVLEDTGITTREATGALTQFMRAKLPLNWYDPIQKATYSIQDLARAAQETAVAVGENSSDTFNRFIDFINTGNSTLLNTVGIMRNANPMYEEYAKSIGKASKALTENEKKMALVSGLIKETASLHGVYTEAMKSASKQLSSMTRLIEQLRVEWGRYFEPIIATAIFRLNQFIELLTDVPDSAKQTITTFITLATAISGMVLGLGFLLPKLKGIFAIASFGAKLLVGKFGIVLTLIAGVAAAVSKLFLKIPAEGEGVAGIMERINSLIDNFDLGKTFEPLANIMSMVREHLQAIAYRVRKFFDEAGDRVKSFMAAHPEVAAFLERAKTVLGDLLATVWHVLDKVLGGIEDLLDGDWQGFFDKIKTAGTYIVTWLVELFGEVISAAYDWGKNMVGSLVKGIMDFARNAIPRAMTEIGNMIAMFLEGHSPPKRGPLSGIATWGSDLMGTLEAALQGRGVDFNEGMFHGLGSIASQSHAWGANITDVFAQGIMGKAKEAIGPAMGEVGAIIARFLEGHSPPAEGKLAQIQDWGRNVFEAFLAGFEMADFEILDNGLSLIRQRLEQLVGDAEGGAAQIARAMIKVREAIAGAISQARMSGGPLDLSSLQNVIVGGLTAFAQDISDLLSAMFNALRAQEAYQALEEQIRSAQEARQAAIDAAQERLDAIQDEIEAINDQVEALEAQMEAQVQAQLEAMGIMVDEQLMKELQRQLADANTEVQRAQRRIERVRGQAGKYGQNILTWEEVNAQAQLDLAEQRRDSIQEQIDVQEEIQREAERIRDQIAEQYQAQFDALKAQLEDAEARAKAAQDAIEGLQKADQAATKEENKQLEAARKHAAALADHAALLEKLLAERMAAEEEQAKLTGDLNGKEEEINQGLADAAARAEERLRRLREHEELREGMDLDEPPQFSNIFEKWLDKVGLSFEGGLPGLVSGIREKIISWWDGFLLTDAGQFVSELGITGVLKTLVGEAGEILGRIGETLGQWAWSAEQVWKWLGKISGEGGVGEALQFMTKEKMDETEGTIEVLSEFIQVIIDLLSFDFKRAGDDFHELINAAAEHFSIWGTFDEQVAMAEGWIRTIETWLGQVDEWARAGESIGAWLGEQGGWTQFWQGVKDGFQSVLDDIGKFDEFMASMPTKIEEFLASIGTFFEEIITGATNLPQLVGEAIAGLWDAIVGVWEGIYNFLIGNSLIPDLINGIVAWFTGLPGKLLLLATDLLTTAATLGKQLFNGIWQWVAGEDGILGQIGGWFGSIGETVAATAETMLEKAKLVAVQIWTAFWNFIMGEEGLVSKIGGWIMGLADIIGAADILQRFVDVATGIGTSIVEALKTGIQTTAGGLVGVVKGLWNDHLRGGFQTVIDGVGNSINGIIDTLNSAAGSIGLGGWGPFPIPKITIPQLPQLNTGGVITDDIVAQLHAGEVVLPLDRLADIVGGMQNKAVPAFAPNIYLQGTATPGQVQPAVAQAYDWWLEKNRRAG